MDINFGRVLELVKFHGGIFLKGLVRTIYGTAVAGLVGIAVYGFILIESEAGYLAVCDFVVSCATLAIAMFNMYMMGGKKRSGRK